LGRMFPPSPVHIAAPTFEQVGQYGVGEDSACRDYCF
jgi:hypothetical protein